MMDAPEDVRRLAARLDERQVIVSMSDVRAAAAMLVRLLERAEAVDGGEAGPVNRLQSRKMDA